MERQKLWWLVTLHQCPEHWIYSNSPLPAPTPPPTPTLHTRTPPTYSLGNRLHVLDTILVQDRDVLNPCLLLILFSFWSFKKMPLTFTILERNSFIKLFFFLICSSHQWQWQTKGWTCLACPGPPFLSSLPSNSLFYTAISPFPCTPRELQAGLPLQVEGSPAQPPIF